MLGILARVEATVTMTVRLEDGGGSDRDHLVVAATIESCLSPVLQ